MFTLQEFHQDFIQSILSDSESRGLLKPQSFFEIVCEDLMSVGDLTKNYTQAEYIKRGLEIYGYDYDDERKILTLLTHQFFQEIQIQTLSKTQIDLKFSRLKTFYDKCIEGLYRDLEETSEAYSMAYNIYKYSTENKIDNVRLMILTDGKATRNLTEISSEKNNGINVDFRVIDIEYLNNIYLSESKSAFFEINVDLPCLKVNGGSDTYESYLSVVNGDLLFKIYEEHGQKLFEQNVRTFLQFRGAVNKKLRNTIEHQPEMFFAYNNGITATATEVVIGENNNIVKIKNLQIVNGGQTTSAIYASKKNSNIDISKVSVQMKLSVVAETKNQDVFVSKVAEYANTQNKINNSDFFSNSPFHKDIKEYSNRIFAPAIGGVQRRTHWYYERVRGEYLNSQAYLSTESKKKFLLENPKNQVIDKTLLSKTENMWLQKPDIVSRGAQDSFKKFADDITDRLEKDNLAITESYFKDAISRVILFRKTESIISKSSWYDGGFRAQTVAYTIAYLSAVIENSGVHLNFNIIWEKQELPQSLIKMLEIISERVYQSITHPPSGFANISQWAKNSGCWKVIKGLDIDLGDVDSELFLDEEENKFVQKENKAVKVLDKGIDMQIFVLKINIQDWKKLYEYYVFDKAVSRLSSMQMGILQSMANGLISLPSEKQSVVLYKIYEMAKNEGFII
jgi:hypothetical protein